MSSMKFRLGFGCGMVLSGVVLGLVGQPALGSDLHPVSTGLIAVGIVMSGVALAERRLPEERSPESRRMQ